MNPLRIKLSVTDAKRLFVFNVLTPLSRTQSSRALRPKMTEDSGYTSHSEKSLREGFGSIDKWAPEADLR